MTIEVVVELPSMSIVVVQLNLTGRPFGSEYLIVTAPVSLSRERVKVTGMCSSDLIPYFSRPLLVLPPIELWESA